MLFHSLDEIFTHIDSVRAEVVSRLEGLDEAQLACRAGGEGWCPRELAEHLSMVEKSITGVVERLLNKSEELGVPAAPDGRIDPPVKFPSAVRNPEMGKVEAPERIKPQGGIALAESLANLAASREHIKGLRPRMAAIDLSAAKFPHPVMNELNLYQWLIFVAEHEAWHLAQINNILKNNE